MGFVRPGDDALFGPTRTAARLARTLDGAGCGAEQRWQAFGQAMRGCRSGICCIYVPGTTRLPNRGDPAHAAYFHPELAEFILPYERVRLAPDPGQLILNFYQSTYEMGASLAGWDRSALERPDPTRSTRGVGNG